MMIYDFNNVRDSGKLYGGQAGLKMGAVIESEKWLIKFPKSTKGLRGNVEISYTTSPLSEYIGSEIYSSIGIAVHETRLGVKDGKVVVACKDFLDDDEILYEFMEIKNYYVPGLEEEIGSISSLSNSNGVELEEILLIMKKNKFFKEIPDLTNHFWNMFVIDALVGNNDRNNGNWGIIFNKKDGSYRPAPVYDNGNAFSNKASARQMANRMASPNIFREVAYLSSSSAFTERGKPINPLRYIESGSSEQCNAAVLRIVPEIDMNAILNIILEIPNEAHGVPIISDIQKDYYYKILEYRYKNVLDPAYENIKEKRTDISKEVKQSIKIKPHR